jgi:hypothetical protein
MKLRKLQSTPHNGRSRCTRALRSIPERSSAPFSDLNRIHANNAGLGHQKSGQQAFVIDKRKVS